MGKIRRILGDNIRTLRTNKGWTQVYLADRLQITAPFLAQIESGKRGMSLELIESAAAIFNIPIASLFFDYAETDRENGKAISRLLLETVKTQLKETMAEDIDNAFAQLR